MTIAERIKEARRVAGITQQQLAVRAGVSVTAVARWETGANPSSLARAALDRALPGLALSEDVTAKVG